MKYKFTKLKLAQAAEHPDRVGRVVGSSRMAPNTRAKEEICRANNTFIDHANLAQLVEHFIRNEEVVGSIPIVGSLRFPITSGSTFRLMCTQGK